MSRREPAASPFRDLSNLGTPRPDRKPAVVSTPLQGPTPTPLRRRRPVAGSGAPKPTPLERRLRALEVDQSRSARRAESGRERALRSFAASASSWLSLLLRDPAACGCSPATVQPGAAGKRDSPDGERAGGRSPKRRRGGDRAGERRKGMTPAMAAALKNSLSEACSLDDVTERMGRYMSKDACEEVLVMMCQICKNIDEGRLKMKAHCPLVTDLRLKEKATRIFMCYNPEWLRIGLHIVLGGDSLQNGSGKRDKEVPFLKLILEKQIFAQILTEKSFAHKKVVGGHHKQGYSEALGDIILKRIFLLVAALDRAKLESTLPLERGIDGLDGGSSLLFCQQNQIKSSRQIIEESLGESMHGEGDLVMHLTTMGYKLSYRQPALSEHDFTIGSLFEDLQDGIILCRVVQLLLSDPSIIMKVIAPSDTHKKKLHNCTMAIQTIKHAGVPLSDPDGVTISAEDVANGDKELILSLLWNTFIHMQVPLLAKKTSVARELARLQVSVKEGLMVENKSHICLLYDWVQMVCSKYGMSLQSTSRVDRRTLSCIINYYLNINAFPLKKTLTGCQKELFTCHELDAITDLTSCPYSKMEKVLADFLKDIPASGILTDDVLLDERSAILLLAFLYSHLTNEKRLGQLKNLINTRFHYQSPESKISARRRSQGNGSCTNQDWAATIIQTQARCMIAKNKYYNCRKAIFILQGAMRAWIAVKRNRSSVATAYTPWDAHGRCNRYFVFIIERHRFVQMRNCAITIQRDIRFSIKGRKIVLHSVLRLQRWWRKFLCQSNRTSVISLQSFVRGSLARKQFIRICCCVNIIQRWWRKVFKTRKRAVIVIQSHFKAYLVRKVSKQDVAHIRSRLQKSSAQVDDDMRLINRLVAALSQLVHRRSLSSIRQTCATLSTATEYSKKCCETLVDAGAVDILLKQIHLLNRGVPDQEVLKQVLLTLRNIARFLNLRSVLLSSPGSVEIIFQKLLRNKADVFFIAADILKKLCESKEGHETVRALQNHVKRLRNLLLNLEKTVELDKRNGRTSAAKETNLRRLGEAATLYHLLTSEQ